MNRQPAAATTDDSLDAAAPVVHGTVETGFERVRDAFVSNFQLRGDLGACCSVYVGGQMVVDIWAGVADRRTGAPWDEETTAVIFSCTKGVLTMCAYLLVQSGELDLDAPIARYWPEFSAAGKQAITVRDAMSHRAGLPALEVDLSLTEVLAWEPVIRALESHRPLFAPTDGFIYHAMTFGWLVGEVIRRITSLLPGQFLRQQLAEPLDLRTWIGLPTEAAASVAWMEPPPEDAGAAAAEAAIEANPLIERSYTMGAYPFPASDGFVSFNDPAIRAAQIPGANGISDARSLARLYAACVSPVAGAPLLDRASIIDTLRVRSAGPSLSGLPDDGERWGTGFQLSSPPGVPMLGRDSFGHAGAGGQLAFADVRHAVGFAYLSNQMGGPGDERANVLTEAVADALGG
jgi:CubicO group peptidase (beta-lactamase class C family)